MTDEMRNYEKAICELCGVSDIGDVSDGFHTFNQLYHQRAMLFAALVKQNKSRAWKTHRHEDGELCFGGGWFLVTIDTPEGAYGYHYEDKYWDMFDCKELERAKPWDGYTEEDVGRLLSLPASDLCSLPQLKALAETVTIPYTETQKDIENAIASLTSVSPNLLDSNPSAEKRCPRCGRSIPSCATLCGGCAFLETNGRS